MGISTLLNGYFPEGSFVWLTFCYSVYSSGAGRVESRAPRSYLIRFYIDFALTILWNYWFMLTSYYLLCALYMYRTSRTLQRHCTENRIKIFPERKLRGISPNFCIHISVSALYAYSHDRSAYLAAGKEVDGWWEYINRSHIYECKNWE
jgi:hypothetical protein